MADTDPTATDPICGAEVVTREYEGMAAEIVLCQRRGGPCPWRKVDGTFAGLRRSDAESCTAVPSEEATRG